VCLCARSLDDQRLRVSPKQPIREETETVSHDRQQPIRNKTTAEWVEFINELEEDSIADETEGKTEDFE